MIYTFKYELLVASKKIRLNVFAERSTYMCIVLSAAIGQLSALPTSYRMH
jgi:hypothetical protein